MNPGATKRSLQRVQELINGGRCHLHLELLPALPAAHLLRSTQIIVTRTMPLRREAREPCAAAVGQQPVDKCLFKAWRRVQNNQRFRFWLYPLTNKGLGARVQRNCGRIGIRTVGLLNGCKP